MTGSSCIIPTVVPASVEEIKAVRERFPAASAIHIDVTDGVFAPKKTWTPPPGYKLPDAAQVLYEVHLMVDQPLAAGLAYAHAGARRMIGHVESFRHADAAQDIFMMWRGAGVKEIGLALKLDTLPKEVVPYADLVDFVHLMTIAEIGEQGKPFDERALERIARFHGQFPTLPMSIDGGVTEERIRALRDAGIARFCVGHALSMADDPAAAFDRLSSLCTATHST